MFFGSIVNKLGASVRRALSQYAVGANEPELALNFIDNEYITNNSTSTFASAVTHSMSSNSTMVDSDGYIKWAPHNLVGSSEDFSSVTVVGVGASTDTITEAATTSEHRIQIGETAVVGYQYTLEIDAKVGVGSRQLAFRGFGKGASGAYPIFNLSSGTITQSGTGFSDVSITDVGDGYYRCKATVLTSSASQWLVHMHTGTGSQSYTGDGTSTILIRKASMYRSDLGGMVDNPDRGDSYVPTTSSAVYLPRIGHHVYNGSAWANEGLLAESKQRANKLPKSGEFSTWPKRPKVTVTDDAEISPDGTQSASTIVPTTVSGEHYIQYDLSATTGNFVDSIYVKADGYEQVMLRPVHIGATEGNTQSLIFNIVTGTVLQEPSGTTASIQNVGNGWFRIAAGFSISGTIGENGFRIHVLDNSGTLSFAGDGTSGIQVYGAQREQASDVHASSFIPTSGSTVTRAAETFTIPSANLPWSGTATSIAVDGRVTYTDTDDFNQVKMVQWQDDTNNLIRVRIGTNGSSTGKPQIVSKALGTEKSTTTSTTYFAPDILVPYDMAGVVTTVIVRGAEGGEKFTDSSAMTDIADLSSTDLSLANVYMGTIGTFRIWDKDITDDGLIEATNPSLEPSLSLTFEGTGTNSFVVNDWSE